MDSENPIDDLKKIVPFERGPDDSQEESEIRDSLLESIIVADPKLSPIQKTLRSLAGNHYGEELDLWFHLLQF